MAEPIFDSQLPLVLLGAGGHARVLLALVRATGLTLLGVCDPGLQAEGRDQWEGLTVLGADNALDRYGPDEVNLLLGVGQLPRSSSRAQLYDLWSGRGYSFPPLIHRVAWASPDVELPDGTQIMAGAVVQPGCVLGRNTIINTRASIDHDCRIGTNVHVAPGAVLCGAVEVGDGAFIGAGAVLIQGLRVGPGAIIGAGVTLVRDLAPGAVVVGSANRRQAFGPGHNGTSQDALY